MEDGQRKVLIVEDDHDLRVGMGLRIGQRFKAITAEDGVSAMQAARTHRPDAIILDLGLPAGDGIKVLEWLREDPELALVPVMVLTGQSSDEAERKAFEAGAKCFLRKPAESDELFQSLDWLLETDAPARKRILLVEDDQDVREGLRTILNANGYEVVVATDGASALLVARKHTPDAVLLDLGLPGGSGLKVLERMKALDGLSHIPIIVLSGKDPEVFRDVALAAGASAYLEKPSFHLEILTAVGSVT